MAVDKKEESASLRVVLYADTVVVRQSSDPSLWQDVLAAINGRSALKLPVNEEEEQGGEAKRPAEQKVGRSAPASGNTPLEKFSSDIGVSIEEVQGACDPKATEPYLILDHDAWEAFKTQLGDRGPQAVAPAAAASTLLALWFKYSNGQANATITQAQLVLKSLSIRDANAARGIKRCDWLQPRASGQVILNPAKITRAKLFAKCFCSQNWAEWKSK